MNLLKRLTISLGLVLLLTTGLSGGVAKAHVLKQNNGISGVLHIPPIDEPNAGELTKLDISFGDQTSGFNLQDCDCKVSIARDGKILQTVLPEPALQGATLESVSRVTFPKVGVYDIIATGSDKAGTFPSFKLTYTVRVASGEGAVTTSPVKSMTNSGPTMLIVGVGSFAVLAMLAFVAIGQGGRYTTTPEANKTKKNALKSKR